MKTSKILLLLSAIFCFASCSNDDAEYNVLDTQKVVEVEDFVDERDGKTYKCVKIGNQIWMAENLAYYIPTGQLAGCYIWSEAEMNLVELNKELAGLGEGLSDADYVDLYNDMYWNNWICPDPAEDDALYNHRWDLKDGYFTKDESLAYLQENCPAFYAVIYERVQAMSMTEEQLLLKRTEEHSNKYISNYKEEEGYFYTLDGAKAAVPEGWRLPSDEDWKKLEAALGMSSDIDVMNDWRGVNAGDYLKVGGEAKFNAIYTGCNAWVYRGNLKEDSPSYPTNYWINRNYSAYYWCSDESTRTETVTPEEGEEGEIETVEVREGIIRQVSIYSSQIWRGITRTDRVCYSVRCVKDAN